MRLRSGVDYIVEEEADRLLAEGRRGITALSEKRDYLTADQLRLRASREIANSTGVCDESLVSGIFRRCYNPMFGKRPGKHRSHDDDY